MVLAGGKSSAKVSPRSPRRIHAPSGIAFIALTGVPLSAVTGPRSDGHQPQFAAGKFRLGQRLEPRGRRRAGMSTRNRAGAFCGMLVSISARMLAAAPDKRDQHRQPEPERHRQPHRRRAGAVERGDAEPGDRAAAMPRRARDPADRQPEHGEQPAQPGDGRDPDRREAAVAGAEDGERGGGASATAGRDQVARARAARRRPRRAAIAPGACRWPRRSRASSRRS